MDTKGKFARTHCRYKSKILVAESNQNLAIFNLFEICAFILALSFDVIIDEICTQIASIQNT